jgi:hypothetical protein
MPRIVSYGLVRPGRAFHRTLPYDTTGSFFGKGGREYVTFQNPITREYQFDEKEGNLSPGIRPLDFVPPNAKQTADDPTDPEQPEPEQPQQDQPETEQPQTEQPQTEQPEPEQPQQEKSPIDPEVIVKKIEDEIEIILKENETSGGTDEVEIVIEPKEAAEKVDSKIKEVGDVIKDVFETKEPQTSNTDWGVITIKPKPKLFQTWGIFTLPSENEPFIPQGGT